MFTAVVLVCGGLLKEPDSCFTYMSEMIFETREECKASLNFVIENELLDIVDTNTGIKFKVTKTHCLNWNAENI